MNASPILEIIGTGLTLLLTGAGLLGHALRAQDRRIEERMRLFFSNGGGDLIAARVKLSLIEALNEHSGSCPLHDRVAELSGQVPSRRRG